MTERAPSPLLDLDEEQHLVRLLTLLRDRGGAVPRTPTPVWRALATLTPQPAVELLVTSDGNDVLCTWRQDGDWHGWHLPGGFVGPGESAEQACGRMAQRELGITVTVVGFLGSFAWPDHPYATALSLLYVCRAKGGVDELNTRHDGTLFRRRPPLVIANHGEFIDRFFATAPHAVPPYAPPPTAPPTPPHAAPPAR